MKIISVGHALSLLFCHHIYHLHWLGTPHPADAPHACGLGGIPAWLRVPAAPWLRTWANRELSLQVVHRSGVRAALQPVQYSDLINSMRRAEILRCGPR